jgi:hypothetical protein
MTGEDAALGAENRSAPLAAAIARAQDTLFDYLPKDEIIGAYLKAAGNEVARGRFSSPRSSALLAANTFGFFVAQLPSAATVRKPEMISGLEFAAAALTALRENLAVAHDELVIEVARMIGFARVGDHVREAIEEAIERHLTEHVERDHLARLRLEPGSDGRT